MTTKKLNLFQRLAAAMAEVTYVQKEEKQGMRYSIVSHDAVTAKVRPALLKHGVIYAVTDISTSQDGNRTTCSGVVTFFNIDDPTDKLETCSFGFGVDTQDKGPGKAMSYMVKYALLKTLGLETGDDPDFDQEAEHKDAIVEDLEARIDAANEQGELDEIGIQIREHAPMLQKKAPAVLAQLRQKFMAKSKTFKEAA